MLALQTTTWVLVAVYSMLSVFFGMAFGFFAGRYHALANAPKKLEEDRKKTLDALVSLMECTQQLNSDVDEHNTELTNAQNDIAAMEIKDEFEHDIKNLQSQLVSNINRVVESNRKMENELIVSQYKLETQAQELDRTRHEARTDTLCGVGNRKSLR